LGHQTLETYDRNTHEKKARAPKKTLAPMNPAIHANIRIPVSCEYRMYFTARKTPTDPTTKH
jgi:hypothetical protein